MSNPHMRRLQVDYQKMKELDIRSPFVDILDTKGDPPYQYVLRLSCKGIVRLDSNERPIYGDNHHLGILLPEEYPRERPQFRFLTPLWHPNIHDPSGTVCYGDEGDHGFAPSMGLDDLIVRIIQMVRYENIGFNSPFNARAANWASRNRNLFPLDTRQIVEEDMILLVDDINIVDDSNDLDIKIF